MGTGPIINEYDRTLYKKCIKCRQWKAKNEILDDSGALIRPKEFGDHGSTQDGVQTICYACKNQAAKSDRIRVRNVTQRIRHHTATRCLTQLGEHAPDNFVRDLEDYLGYRVRALVKHLSIDLREREGQDRKLRDALQEGYHIDHIRPLSSFNVVLKPAGMGETVDWEEFRRCWAITNLSAIPAADNLAKGAQYDAETHAEETEQEDSEEGQEEETPDEQE